MSLQASSPDEEALVLGAAYAGYRLVNRSQDKLQVHYHDYVWEYQVRPGAPHGMVWVSMCGWVHRMAWVTR